MASNGYMNIYQTLKEEIEANHFAPGAKLESENQMVKDYSSSRMTIRKALARLESEGLVSRRPGIGTFVSEPTALPDPVNRRLNIAVSMHPEWGQIRSFMLDALSSVHRACQQNNCNLLLLGQEELLSGGGGKEIDGAILTFLDPNEYRRAELFSEQTPTVLLGRIPQNFKLNYVTLDDLQISENLTQRMLQNDFTRILFIGGSTDPLQYAWFNRETGYRNAFRRQNIPIDENLIMNERDVRNYHNILEVLEREKPQKIIVSCEYFLTNLLIALKLSTQLDKKNIELVCFDRVNQDDLFECGNVISGDIPYDAMSLRAIEYICGAVRNHRREQDCREVFPMGWRTQKY